MILKQQEQYLKITIIQKITLRIRMWTVTTTTRNINITAMNIWNTHLALPNRWTIPLIWNITTTLRTQTMPDMTVMVGTMHMQDTA